MAFRCGICNQVQAPGTRAITKVSARRERTYSTPGGDIPGWEIAQEIRVCGICAGTVVPTTVAAVELVLEQILQVE
jgi:hypothetical protein